jgi:hypothetical protein
MPAAEFAAVAEKAASDGWARDRDNETQMAAGASKSDVWVSFVLNARAGLSPIYLWMTTEDSDVLHVANIISRARDHLTYAEYNDVLASFLKNVLQKIDPAHGLTYELSSDTIDVSRDLPGSVIQRLRQFSALANKHTGSGQPYDRDRWFDFLIESERSGSPLAAHILQRWLVEEEGWEDDQASKLAEEYEYGRELLSRSRAS